MRRLEDPPNLLLDGRPGPAVGIERVNILYFLPLEAWFNEDVPSGGQG